MIRALISQCVKDQEIVGLSLDAYRCCCKVERTNKQQVVFDDSSFCVKGHGVSSILSIKPNIN